MQLPPAENQMNPRHYKALVDYVRDKTRDAKGVTPPESDISDDVLMGIVEVLCALRALIETEEGVVWLYRLTGIEERQPHVGFVYFLVTPATGVRTPMNARLSPHDHGSRRLTIYVRNVYDQQRNVTDEIVNKCHQWLYARPDCHPVKSASFVRYVLEHAREWFLGPTGTRWLEEQYSYPTRLKVYKALSIYGETAYKVTEGGSTFFAGPRLEGVNQTSYVEYEPKTYQTCDSCSQKYPCIQSSDLQGHLCCSCLGQMSRESLGVLDFCAHNECRAIACPNVLTMPQVRNRQRMLENTIDGGIRP